MATTPVGYSYEDPPVRSPVTEQDLNRLLTDVMWTEQDAAALRRAGEILAPRASEILDVWYDFIGSTPHLVTVFRGPDGEPDQDYLARVRERFEQWVADLCTREFDAQWLAYQEEIALRHHSAKKNQTDAVDSPAAHVPMSDMLALLVPVTQTVRDFLAQGESDAAAVDAMQQAWFKAVTVSLVLWTRPYAADLW
ncbi:protoglobin domain-containing protein [Bounagaea algeriensis]